MLACTHIFIFYSDWCTAVCQRSAALFSSQLSNLTLHIWQNWTLVTTTWKMLEWKTSVVFYRLWSATYRYWSKKLKFTLLLMVRVPHLWSRKKRQCKTCLYAIFFIVVIYHYNALVNSVRSNIQKILGKKNLSGRKTWLLIRIKVIPILHCAPLSGENWCYIWPMGDGIMKVKKF